MSDLATKRQTWAIFCATKQDVRNVGLTKAQASTLIGKSKAGIDILPEVLALIGESPKTAAPSTSKAAKWAALWKEAQEAGMAAGNAAQPTPMIVERRMDPLDDNSPVVERYAPVADGVCGFAVMRIRPGTCSFARWLKKQGVGYHDDYHGGWSVAVHAFNQSYERKMAYASAAAKVLNEAGVTTYVDGRLD